MKIRTNKNETGFSIAELMIAMVIMLVLMGIASTLFSKALGVRSVPAVAIDGKLADCCTHRGIDMEALRAAGLGTPL